MGGPGIEASVSARGWEALEGEGKVTVEHRK